MNPGLARVLKTLVDEIWPGPPFLAYPVLFRKGDQLNMGAISVKDSSAPLGATVSFVDAKGAPATADDVPVWASDNAASADVVAADDGLSAVVTIGLPGTANITVTSTDLDGTVITSAGVVSVTPGEAEVGDVEFTAPA